jgi:hypothetical protein
MIEVVQQQLRVLQDGLWIVRIQRLYRLCDSVRRVLLRLYHGLIVGERRQLVVIIVPIELLLDRAVSQARHMLLEFGIINVLPLFVNVVLVEVVFRWRNERRAQSPLVQGLPVEVAEPRVVLDLGRARVTESILGLALDHLVDEVGGLDAPTRRYVLHLYLDLLGHNVLADLLPALAHVRPLAVHALVRHDTDGKVINCLRVVEAEHDLGRHVARRAGCVGGVLRAPDARNTEVGDAQVAVVVDDEVLGLDVAVQDLLLVAVLEACD